MMARYESPVKVGLIAVSGGRLDQGSLGRDQTKKTGETQ